MKGLATLSAALALSASTAHAAVAQLKARDSLPSITVKGNAFFNGNTRFYVRGVDYQPGGSSQVQDPIADPQQCDRDIAEFKKLGINTIRVYSVDNSKNHDHCMQALSDAGIYLVLDVNTPKYSLNRNDPATSYNDVYLQNVFATVDAFHNYTNTLAFFSGNEVINDAGSTKCAPYVKAVTRDIRMYISSRGYRQIPVGYSAADVEENRKEMADYMNCGDDSIRSDFFAFNDYSWCDPSDFVTSGWSQKVQNFSDYSIPLFLSEFGCNTNKRTFGAVKSLYSTDMSAVFSGGLVYEYSEEGSNYGLVQINGDSVSELDDFNELKSAYANQSDPSGDGGYKSSGTASQCPPQSADWDVTTEQLPALPSPAQKYMTQGAGQGVGLGGSGSQTAGTPSSGFASGTGNSTTKKKGAAATVVPSVSVSILPVFGALVVVFSSLLTM